ncbi:DUF7065 domain-containing protein [Nocardioides jensenii]|uniref:DUF7065 domain-containing protein n=1 Tax=Nocardioides jensenii TaxID=1843 RepID=UPI00082CF572|nr:hypothetical protein [Nocardioides jensenii]
MSDHPDDNFHVPKDDDPFWTETSWYTFSVPGRRLSGQVYPFFRPNQGVAACAVFIWDETGDQIPTARYARQSWHLTLPDQPLSDLTLPNGLAYKTVEPQSTYQVTYQDPDGEDVALDLTFTGLTSPHHTGHGHLDQPCHVQGTITLDGEVIEVDDFGFRDRSWGRRGGFGKTIMKRGGAYAGYSFASESADTGFHVLAWERNSGECEIAHGHLRLDGVWSPMSTGVRRVLARDGHGNPTRIQITGTDEIGRTLEAVGEAKNAFGILLNPNIWCVNALVEWTFNGRHAWGEDHDNWAPSAYRRRYRSLPNAAGAGLDPALVGS